MTRLLTRPLCPLLLPLRTSRRAPIPRWALSRALGSSSPLRWLSLSLARRPYECTGTGRGFTRVRLWNGTESARRPRRRTSSRDDGPRASGGETREITDVTRVEGPPLTFRSGNWEGGVQGVSVSRPDKREVRRGFFIFERRRSSFLK